MKMAFWNQRSLQPKANPRGVLFHALHKSASMFLFKLFFRLSKERRMQFYSQNLKVRTNHLVTPDIDHDFCFGPIRHFKTHKLNFDAHVDVRRIFQLRDPRDILVSEYYSFGWRHTENRFGEKERLTRDRIKNQTLEEYVLEEEGASFDLTKRLDDLLRASKKPGTTFVSYEQMVNDFPGWLQQVMEPFGFPESGLRSKKMLFRKYCWKYKNNFSADPSDSSHKRNVKPGEHRLKLKPATIRELNRRFDPYREFFDFGVDSKVA